MKKMNFKQMEVINGGQTVAVGAINNSTNNTNGLSVNTELACNIALGAVGVAMGAALGITTFGLSLLASYTITVWAYYGCQMVTGKYK